MAALSCKLSSHLNWLIERIVAFLMLLLVLDVWLGVVDRYIFHWELPWPEIVARYLMIWAALLAISCGIARRDHIGLSVLVDTFPRSMRRAVLLAMDAVTVLIFLYIAVYGLGFTRDGAQQHAMIFGMTMAVPYAAVPVSAGLAMVQAILAGVRDAGEAASDGQAGGGVR